MKPTSADASPPPAPCSRGPALMLVIVLIGLAGFFLLRRAPRTSPPADISRLEVHLTNLVMNAGQWRLRDGTNVFTGMLVDSYPNGAARSRSAVSNGLLHGLSIGWFTNGQVQVEEHFLRGTSHGTRTKWHSNGRKLSEAGIADGRLEGMFRRWDDQGLLTEEMEMRDGKPDGVSRSFYPSGCVKAEVRLKAGEVVEQRNWQDGEMRVGDAESAPR